MYKILPSYSSVLALLDSKKSAKPKARIYAIFASLCGKVYQI